MKKALIPIDHDPIISALVKDLNDHGKKTVEQVEFLIKKIEQIRKQTHEHGKPYWAKIEARLRELGKISETNKDPSLSMDIENNLIYEHTKEDGLPDFLKNLIRIE